MCARAHIALAGAKVQLFLDMAKRSVGFNNKLTIIRKSRGYHYLYTKQQESLVIMDKIKINEKTVRSIIREALASEDANKKLMGKWYYSHDDLFQPFELRHKKSNYRTDVYDKKKVNQFVNDKYGYEGLDNVPRRRERGVLNQIAKNLTPEKKRRPDIYFSWSFSGMVRRWFYDEPEKIWSEEPRYDENMYQTKSQALNAAIESISKKYKRYNGVIEIRLARGKYKPIVYQVRIINGRLVKDLTDYNDNFAKRTMNTPLYSDPNFTTDYFVY